jgi:hypothetical protein
MIRNSYFAFVLSVVIFLAISSQCIATEAVRTPTDVPNGLNASDWSSIREAYEAGQYFVQPIEDGYRAINRGQQWITSFDGRGFTTKPEHDDWSWGLNLESYGWGKDIRAVTTPHSVNTERQKVAYIWDENLTEWYVNDSRGLEHGYTIVARPEQANGPLMLKLAVRGGLRPVVSQSGRNVSFAAANDGTALNYTGLSVFDADGQALEASWQVVSGDLHLGVDDKHARYPLTIDPIAQQAYLKASNTDILDSFGWSVSISGDTVVVGAVREQSNATGVNGNQSDNSLSYVGAAYVFVRNGSTWSQQAYLKASNPDASDRFGEAVSISGDTIVVGATSEDSSATGVNGQNNNNTINSGAAYVFVRNGSTWSQQAYLKASNPDVSDVFGISVSVAGDTIVVGALYEHSNATGVNGNQSDNSCTDCGAAYVFVRNGSIWSQQAYLKASNTDPIDYFGRSVSVAGDTIVVGAPNEDSSTKIINGNQSDNSAPGAGAAYVFVRNGSTWSQQAYLKASNAQTADWFGFSVSISGDTIVVGAEFEDSSATGVDGNQNNNSLTDSGAAYVFVRSGTTWSQQAYLKGSGLASNINFGYSVSASGDTVAVGYVLGNEVSVFARNGTSWCGQANLSGSNTEAGDKFGYSLAISGNTVIVGAPHEASGATGVNGNQNDNSKGVSGAVYVFSGVGPTQSTARVSVKRVLSANQTVPTGWGTVDDGYTEINDSITKASTVLQAQLGISLVLDEVVDIMDPGTPYSWFNVDVADTPQDKIKAMEDAAEADPCTFRWRTDAINLYLVNSRYDSSQNNQGVGGFSSFPGAPHSEIIFIQKNLLNNEMGLAHEVGHYFNLYHTFENHFGAEQQHGCATPSVNCLTAGDKLCDTPADPYDPSKTSLQNLTALNNLYGSCAGQSAYNTLAHNVMSYYSGINFTNATFTAGQQCRAQNAVLFDRQNVLTTTTIPQPMCTWTYLGHSKAGVFGAPFLEGAGTLQPLSTMTLSLTNALPSTTAYMVMSSSELNQPFYGGILVPQFTSVYTLTTDINGELIIPFTMPSGLPSGVPIYMQYWIQDMSPTSYGMSASNAIRAVTP